MATDNAQSIDARESIASDTVPDATLRELRAKIERVDATIIAAIAERMHLARAVGRLKAATGQPVTDPAREAAVVARASLLAREAGLPEDEIRALYWRLLAVSRRAQHDIT
jgi:chorismate mutase